KSAVPPAAVMSSATARAASASMSVTRTAAPARANSRATAAPIPAPAPVTSAVRPVRSKGERVLCASVISVAPGKFEDMRAEEVEDHLLADRGDPGEAGLSEQTSHRVLLRVAHAAVGLQSAVCRVEAGVRAQVLGHVRLLAARLSVVIEPSGLSQDEFCG